VQDTTVRYKIKARSQEKNAVMKPLLLGMWLADNTYKCKEMFQR
jgi:hypothetical protein